jgi:hypothetical protein
MAGCCELGNEHSGFLIFGEFLAHLNSVFICDLFNDVLRSSDYKHIISTTSMISELERIWKEAITA